MAKEKNENYRIGLDIGISSVGWAVLRHDSSGNPDKILGRGVRVFEACENLKDGKSLAEERREFRSLRRRLRRKQHRLMRIKRLICEEFNMPQEYLFGENPLLFHSQNIRRDIYVIRFEALEKKLEKDEWARLLIHFAQRRGFKSNRNNEKAEGETGKLKTAMKKNESLQKEKNYRTIGELLYKEYQQKKQNSNGSDTIFFETRNSPENYEHTFSRKQTEEEVDIVFEKQNKLGNQFATPEILGEYRAILTSQRSFDEGPGSGSRWKGAGSLIENMVGVCTFENKKNGKEKNEPRAPRNSYTFERFMLVQKVNNLRLIGFPQQEFTEEERKKIINEAYAKSKLTYKQLRKLLCLGSYALKGKPQYVFNSPIYNRRTKDKDENGKELKDENGKSAWRYKTYEECEEETCIELKGYHAIQKIAGKKLSPDELDDIAYCLTVYKNDKRLEDGLREKNFDDQFIKAIVQSAPSFDKFGHLSIKAMKNILPFLETGRTYDKACEAAGYDFRNRNNNGKRVSKLKFTDIEEEIHTPVVKRAVSQTLKIVNAIVREFGEPEFVCIELSREMAKSHKERTEITKHQEENKNKNEKYESYIKELTGFSKVSGQDIEKYKLWIEQQNMCAYSGEKIAHEELFTQAAEVDHIIPWSISFDNSYKNKVIVKTKYNQEKSNRLPMEYIQTKGMRETERYQSWVETIIRNRVKKDALLAIEMNTEGMKEKNLHDTQYATRKIADFIRNNLQFKERGKFESKVLCINGGVTSYVRKRLGLEKKRETDNHHAVDAIIIASCSHKMQKDVAEYEKVRRSCNFKHEDNYWVDRITGEIINIPREYPQPWVGFRKEIELWSNENPQSEANMLLRKELPSYELDEIIQPLFVSRMANHKITGAAHKETILKTGNDIAAKQNEVIKKMKLTALKLKNGEIEGYYNKACDKLLYDALLARLKEFDGDAKKAFEKDFYKPTASGETGNMVKSVKIISGVSNSNLELKKVGAKAANGDMIRIDVFSKIHPKTEKNQFFIVPVYVADFKKKELPNISTNGLEMNEKDGFCFEFSLFAKDLIRIKKSDDEPKLMYYKTADRNTHRIEAISHNKEFEFRVSFQNLELFEKWEVDFLGNCRKSSFVPRNIKTLYKGRRKDYQKGIFVEGRDTREEAK